MPDSNDTVSLRILGPLDLRDGQGEELRRALAQPKRMVLLSFLALAGSDGFRRRDTVVALFWPDLDQLRARAALRQALSWLRHELGNGIFASRGDEEIGVAGESLRCDAVLFDEACGAGQPERALELYRGGLLEGVFVAGAAPELERWLEEERGRLRKRATQAAWALAERESAAGRPARAVAWGRRAVGLAPDDEGEFRRLIHLLVAAGDRAGALEAHARFRERMLADYDAEPSAETQRLMAGVRSSTTPASPAVSPAPPAEGATAAPVGSDSALSVPLHRAPGRRRVLSVPGVIAVSLAAIATGGLALRLLHRPDRATGAAGDILSLVVLPLINVTGDTTLDYLARGVTSTVTAALSRVPTLRAVGPGAIARSLGPDPDPRRAAETAGTAVALAWRLSRLGDSLVIETEIDRAGDGTRLLTDRYGFLPGRLMPVEREIVERIVSGLGPKQQTRPPGNLARRPTSNPAAYLLLLKAEYFLGRRTGAGIRQARDLVLQAIDRDPLYADAYAVLSQSYQGFAWYGLIPADEAFLKAEAAARRAVALDSTSGLAHATLGATLSFFRYRWAEGEAELRRAVTLDPDNGEIRNFYSLHLRSLGRFPEALAEMRRAQALDQLFRHYFRTAGLILTLAGRDEEAVPELRRALELDSAFSEVRELLSRALARLKRYDEALREWRLALELQGDHESAAIVASVHGEAGYHEAERRVARIVLEQLRREQKSGQYVRRAGVAEALLRLGEREAAITALEQAFSVRDPWLIGLPFDPEYREIRDDPRVQALERRMNLR